MKKLMFTLAIAAMALPAAHAQKQLGGEHNIEVSFNPFGGNPINASVIKYRKFMDDDRALRVTLGLDQTSNKYLVVPENSLQEFGATGTMTHRDLFLYNDFSSLNFGVGYELHFKGTDNLSPYFGVAGGISRNSITLKRERFSALNIEDPSADVWVDEIDVSSWGVWAYQNDIKSSTINLDLLFGADYYFNDAIYVGFEAGLRYGRTSGITSTITADNNNAFNIYFDGGQGNSDGLVVNTADPGTGTGYQWNSATEVNYVINSQPWLGEGVSSVNSGLNDEAFYLAADDLWSDWSEQSPANQDQEVRPNGFDGDPARDALFNGSNFLGTYSTGMLRIGFLFE